MKNRILYEKVFDIIADFPPHTREIFLYFVRNMNENGQLFTTYKQIIDDLSWFMGNRKEGYKKYQCSNSIRFLKAKNLVTTAVTTAVTTCPPSVSIENTGDTEDGSRVVTTPVTTPVTTWEKSSIPGTTRQTLVTVCDYESYIGQKTIGNNLDEKSDKEKNPGYNSGYNLDTSCTTSKDSAHRGRSESGYNSGYNLGEKNDEKNLENDSGYNLDDAGTDSVDGGYRGQESSGYNLPSRARINFSSLNNKINIRKNIKIKDKEDSREYVVEETEKKNDEPEKKEKPFSFRGELLKVVPDKILVDDFLANRKMKRLANTQTALKSLLREIEKSGREPEDCIREATIKGWGGFRASWFNRNQEKFDDKNVNEIWK